VHLLIVAAARSATSVASNLGRFHSHSAINIMPCMQRFIHATSAQSVTFAMGALGAPRQDLTTFWYTASLRSALAPLAALGAAERIQCVPRCAAGGSRGSVCRVFRPQTLLRRAARGSVGRV
tara:strand:+ start:372 stop:737 length:366 start_codon:yes stop_codon:yes gene_type:complete